MTSSLTAEAPSPGSLISGTEELYREIAGEVLAALGKIRSGEWDAKGLTSTVRDMRAFLQLVLEERVKVAKLAKQDAGIAYDYALDFEAARSEIGRRLACLRDAGGG